MSRLADEVPPVKDMVRNLREISSGFERGQIFYSAVELNIFTLLKEPRTVGELADQLHTAPALTEKVLKALSSIGLLQQEQQRYRTAEAFYPFLVKGEPYFARYLQHSVEARKYWMGLLDIMIKGPEPRKEQNGFKVEREWVDYIARYALLGRLQATVRAISLQPEFRSSRRVMDLGGCHGLFAIAIAQEDEGIEAWVFDRPEVVGITEEYIAAHGMQGRVRTMAGDFTKDDIGSGYDIVLGLCSIGGPTEENRGTYEKVVRSLNPGGLFVLSDFTLDDDGKGPLQLIIWDMESLMTGGECRRLTHRELAERLGEHGLAVTDMIDMSGVVDVPMRLVIAKKDQGLEVEDDGLGNAMGPTARPGPSERLENSIGLVPEGTERCRPCVH